MYPINNQNLLGDFAQSITVDIVYSKKMFNLAENRLEKVESVSNELSKRMKSIKRRKVKKRTKPKNNDEDELTHFSKLYGKLIESKEIETTKRRKADKVLFYLMVSRS